MKRKSLPSNISSSWEIPDVVFSLACWDILELLVISLKDSMILNLQRNLVIQIYLVYFNNLFLVKKREIITTIGFTRFCLDRLEFWNCEREELSVLRVRGVGVFVKL